jgi:succinyl-CoA synthetase beta subunit
LNLHEHQAKDILRGYGIAVQRGIVLLDPRGAGRAAEELMAEAGNDLLVVKAQIHAGGRGKAGGVKVVRGAGAAQQAANELFGRILVTPQTGPAGSKVRRLFIAQGLDIARELFLAAVLDRQSGRVALMASTEGGVEIEVVAARTPEKILEVVIDPALGLMPFQARRLGFGLGLQGKTHKQFCSLVTALARLYPEEDCSLVEINPLVVSEEGSVVALDAKMSLDDNARFRHPEWDALRDPTEEDPTETEAREHGLSYVQLGGDIGCLVNGAGLAMSTMDIIKHFGGEPANFLDVGGGADREAVTAAFRIILRSEAVRAILVNIFGGIVKCDVIAEGVMAATREVGLEVPLVVRLEGTNAEAGRELLAGSGLAITTAATMEEAARKVVELARPGGA